MMVGMVSIWLTFASLQVMGNPSSVMDKRVPPSEMDADRLKQEQQWRETRLQQAVANGDISAEEADKIRQRWQKQAELFDKWQKGTLTQEEREVAEKILEKKRRRWDKKDPPNKDRQGDDGSSKRPPKI